MQILTNADFYAEINENQDKKVLQKIKKLLNKYPSSLTDKEEDFVTNFDFRESCFYGLPKIHKSATIKEAIKTQNSDYITCKNPEDLTFRPIVGGHSAPTQRLSNLLDIVLKPLCCEVKSYVRDDLDLLRHLPSNVGINDKLVTLDVVNLYSNITSTLGLRSLGFWIDKHREKIDNRFTKEFLLEATELVLKNNFFNFDDQHFQQVKGTAMGTKMAPTYATLTLGYLEELMYQQINENFSEEFSENIKRHWKRYLNDCFIIWSNSDEYLATFHNILNNLDPDINFTIKKSSTSIPFLDVLITKQQDKITTDIYYKSTDTHQYLHFGSSHPRHTKRSIPYNLARRICTIVSDKQTRDQRLCELETYLTEQYYPKNIIKDGIKIARMLNREELINPPPRNCDSKILPFVTTHNPKNPNMTPIVQQLNHILKSDEEMKDVLQNYKFVNSKRQPKNLRRILCSSKYHKKSNFRVNKCKDPRCGTCPFLKEGQTCNFHGKEFTINADMSCDSKNLIYVITCSGCRQIYIGETGTTLRARIRVHKQHIKEPAYRKIKLSEHLAVCGNGHFNVFPFYKLFTDNLVERREKEKYFIHSFKPTLNSLV